MFFDHAYYDYKDDDKYWGILDLNLRCKDPDNPLLFEQFDKLNGMSGDRSTIVETVPNYFMCGVSVQYCGTYLATAGNGDQIIDNAGINGVRLLYCEYCIGTISVNEITATMLIQDPSQTRQAINPHVLNDPMGCGATMTCELYESDCSTPHPSSGDTVLWDHSFPNMF